MTPEQQAEAREAYQGGESARSIARRRGVDHSAVTRRAKREGWVVQARDQGGAVGQRRVPARPDAPEEAQQPTRGDDLGPLLAGDQRREFDINDPADQRRILELTGLAPRPWPEVERRLEELAADQREAEAERRGYRPLGWLRHAPW